MKYRFFTIPTLAPEQAQEELNRFCSGHRIASVEKQFVANGDRSFWTICVSYIEQDNKLPAAGKGKVDYREVLDEKDFAVFVKLRTLRKTISEQEGVPAYALFTNEQLATMVRKRVATFTDLGAIDGVGKARLEKYGKAFLSVLSNEYGGSRNRLPDTSNNIYETNRNHHP